MAYSSIVKPEDYFNTKLWTGNGGTQSITGIGYAPDFVWIKKRTDADGARIFDTVRGAAKGIFTNSTQAETTVTSELSAFDSDGFTLGASDAVNGNTKSYVSWNWLGANGTASNSDGSVASTVSANTTAGFSIVTWTSLASGSNYTVGHGLGSAPAMIILKGRHESNNWMVYHHKNTSAPETDYLMLDDTAATADYPVWNDTAPTSSVFTCGTWSGFDAGGTMVAYCFAEKKGYSKFGKYTGNGQALRGGPLIYLGFKPAFVLLKESSSVENWLLMDNKRLGYNKRNELIFPNLNNAEQAHDRIDLVSNGFKVNDNDGSINQNNETYIYMAFAENPFVANDSGTAVPVTAR